MTHTSPLSAVASADVEVEQPAEAQTTRALSRWIQPLEGIAAFFMTAIILLLLGGVVSRYVFSHPVEWIDEIVSIAFIWVAMLGAAIAMHRNEHLRLTLFLDMMPARLRDLVHAFALVAVAVFLAGLIHPSIEHVQEEWFVTSATLGLQSSYRVAAIPAGLALMLGIVVFYAFRTVTKPHLITAVVVVGALVALCWWMTPQLKSLGLLNLLIFMVALVAVCLAAGVPIAFCFSTLR